MLAGIQPEWLMRWNGLARNGRGRQSGRSGVGGRREDPVGARAQDLRGGRSARRRRQRDDPLLATGRAAPRGSFEAGL